MKKIIAFALLLMVSVASFSQRVTTQALAAKTDYLKKSKNQKTAANILLYGGVASWVTCFFIIPKIKWGPAGAAGIFYATFGIGLFAMPASIPLFMASSRNKKKGMSLSFKNETTPQIKNGSFTARSVPSLTLKISLK